MLQLAVRHRLAVQLVMMALQLSRGCLTAIAQVAVLARRLARQPPCVTFQQPCLCNFYRSYSVPILVNLQLVTAPNGSTVSEEAFIAQLLLELLSAAGHNNTLIWGKSDTVVEHVKQSVPAQLAGYTVMMDHTGSAPHFEDPLRTRMKHVEVAAVFHGMLNQSLMGQLTAANKSVFAWSVDDPGDMQRMLDLGVHGMVTNRPKVLLEAVRSRQ
eukprot:GHUV01023201.1.p1 GENE.GHUV01023201.1~~GHUV01023201.1.p1  ORF type:complete len:213 (+),score=37.17 GHUV01023201.1:1249-1887(+)